MYKDTERILCVRNVHLFHHTNPIGSIAMEAFMCFKFEAIAFKWFRTWYHSLYSDLSVWPETLQGLYWEIPRSIPEEITSALMTVLFSCPFQNTEIFFYYDHTHIYKIRVVVIVVAERTNERRKELHEFLVSVACHCTPVEYTRRIPCTSIHIYCTVRSIYYVWNEYHNPRRFACCKSNLLHLSTLLVT